MKSSLLSISLLLFLNIFCANRFEQDVKNCKEFNVSKWYELVQQSSIVKSHLEDCVNALISCIYGGNRQSEAFKMIDLYTFKWKNVLSNSHKSTNQLDKEIILNARIFEPIIEIDNKVNCYISHLAKSENKIASSFYEVQTNARLFGNQEDLAKLEEMKSRWCKNFKNIQACFENELKILQAMREKLNS